MYKAIIKTNTYIQLDTTKADEPVKPVYDGGYTENRKAIEASYGPFGHLLGSQYSVEELEFALNNLNLTFKVLEDVERNKFYQVEKPDLYT